MQDNIKVARLSDLVNPNCIISRGNNNTNFNPQSKEDVIADYVASGYTLIKVFGKIPTDKAWNKTEYNMFLTAADFPENYGVKLTPDLLVIDYDPRNDDTPGKQALHNLIKYLDNFVFDTYTVITGGNGLHIYMNKPPEIAILEKLPKKDFPQFAGIEFKSVGRQVIGPLSIHPESHKPYFIAYHRPSYRIDASAKLIELIKRADKLSKLDSVKTTLGKYTDDEQSVQRYKSFLSDNPPAIEGDGGDSHTFKTACRGRDFGLSPQRTFEMMWEYWNHKCIPTWTDSDLLTKVRNAYSYNEDVQGKWNPATDFEAITIVSDKFKGILKPISEVMQAKGYRWIVKSFFARGFISIFFGEPGSGKTWLILVLCLNLSNGYDVWNGISVNQSKVLLLEGDAPDDLLKARIEKLKIKLNDEYFHYVNRYSADSEGISLSLSDEKGRKNVEELIKQFRPDFVVLDTLISFIDDEKDAEAVKKVVDHLRKLAERYDCHILICHHSRKRQSGEKRKKFDQSDVIGSSTITRLASIVIGVQKDE